VPTSAEIWYLDTSAFVKLVRRERSSAALRRWMEDRQVCSSDLLRTEARRAVHEEPAPVGALVDELLEAVAMIRLSPELFDRAGRLRGGRRLRSLDALHLAAATELGDDLAGVVTYDVRMAEAAEILGLRTIGPA